MQTSIRRRGCSFDILFSKAIVTAHTQKRCHLSSFFFTDFEQTTMHGVTTKWTKKFNIECFFSSFCLTRVRTCSCEKGQKVMRGQHLTGLPHGILTTCFCTLSWNSLVRYRHVAKGGSEGADEPPFFLDQKKKKKIDGSCVFRCDRACAAVGLRITARSRSGRTESWKYCIVDQRQTIAIPSNVPYQHPLWFSALIGKARA